MSKDYYKILNVEKGSSKEEIKKAYKKLAKKYHPDINKAEDAEAKFKEINEAVSVLGDDSKKQQYDQFGSDYFKQAGGGSGFSNFSQGFGGFSDFGDIFDQFFGGGGGRRQSRRRVYKGNDLLAHINITLEEAAFGTKKTINLNKQEKCDTCNGEGGTGIKTCSVCHGTGQVTSVRRTPFGMFQTTGTCSECGGVTFMLSAIGLPSIIVVVILPLTDFSIVVAIPTVYLISNKIVFLESIKPNMPKSTAVSIFNTSVP